MRAGTLRFVATIQQKPAGRDAFGERVSESSDPNDPNWKVFAAGVPAFVNALKGKELYEASKLYSDVDYVITVRYLDGVTSSMRVVCEDQVYDIRSVINPDSKRRELDLFCRILQ